MILHCHPLYISALCALKDPEIKPIDQSAAKFFNRTSIDLGFDGMANNSDESQRISATLGSNEVMIMGNHGVTVVGETVAEVVEDLYFLERAARSLVLAYSTGKPLNVMSDDIAEMVAQQW